MSTFRTEGIILGYKSYRDYDRLIYIYTKDQGKILVSASGVNKIKSKQAGHLEPLTYVDLMLVKTKSEFYKLATSTTIEPFLSIKSTLEKMIIASYCLEIIYQATYEVGDKVAFSFLLDLLRLFDAKKYQAQEFYLLAEVFGFKLLSLFGYKPELLTCLVCKEPLPDEDCIFDPLGGGLLHLTCGLPESDSFLVDHEIIRRLKFFLVNALSTIQVNLFGEKEVKYIIQILHSFIQIHLDKPLKSAVFLEKEIKTVTNNF